MSHQQSPRSQYQQYEEIGRKVGQEELNAKIRQEQIDEVTTLTQNMRDINEMQHDIAVIDCFCLWVADPTQL